MKKILKRPVKITLLIEEDDEQFFRGLMPEDEKYFSGFMAKLLHQIRLIWETEEDHQ